MTCDFQDLWMPPAEREPAFWYQTPQQATTWHEDENDGVPAEEMAKAQALITAVARAALEALTGYRPLQQLTRWLEPSAIDGVALAMRHGKWVGATVPHVVAGSVRQSIIEGVAHVATPGRRLAIAIRLEQRRGHWACTDLSVLLPGSHLLSQR